MNSPLKIIIADDHPLFRQALLQTLTLKLPNVDWVEAETVEQLVSCLNQNQNADLLLLDLNIPDAHGFNSLIKIRNQYPQLPLVVVSAYEDDDTVIKAMEFGASGFVPKSTPVELIFRAIGQVLKGETWIPEHINLSKVTESTDRTGGLLRLPILFC
jgi:DNA-binding NarL/FixJ family response regulator